MYRDELRLRADMSWRGGDADTFLRRLELAKICPEFPVDRVQEIGISLLAQGSGNKHGFFIRATRRFSERATDSSEPKSWWYLRYAVLASSLRPKALLDSAGRRPNARLQAEGLAEQGIFVACGSRREADVATRRS